MRKRWWARFGVGGTCSRSSAHWDLGVPYELATTCTLLGQACREAGDETGAIVAFAAARRLFDDLGVALDARHLSNIFTKAGVTTRSGATAYAFEHDMMPRSA